MAHYWKALILTQSNVLQNVEIETPGPWREDAIAQVKSTYGAKEVKFCNPIGKSSSNSSSSGGGFLSSQGGDDSSWWGILIVIGLLAIWAFRYIILAILALGAVYLLYKWIKK
jgi:hypothetical protein